MFIFTNRVLQSFFDLCVVTVIVPLASRSRPVISPLPFLATVHQRSSTLSTFHQCYPPLPKRDRPLHSFEFFVLIIITVYLY